MCHTLDDIKTIHDTAEQNASEPEELDTPESEVVPVRNPEEPPASTKPATMPPPTIMPVTFEVLKRDQAILALINSANEQLGVLGYTEHGTRHANLVAHIAHNILARLGFSEREAQLAAIGGYLHDIGNVLTRHNHAQHGGLISMDQLLRLGMDPAEIGQIMGTVGNHEEASGGEPVNAMSAAVIIADKADVHRSRVRNPNPTAFDIHDRVNYASQHSFVRVDGEKKTITLELTIDTSIASVVEYFEIFLSRMLATRKAAQFLDCDFGLVINKNRLL